MPGTYQYDVEIKSNVAKLLSDMKQVQDRLDTVEGKEYKIKLNVDEKKLSNVISNLEKMLDSLGKGTGDFKQFENLSKQLSSITTDIGKISKAFATMDDGSVLVNNIKSIDSSLTNLTNHFVLQVSDKMASSIKEVKGTLSDVGDGKELTPLLNTIGRIEFAIDKLSSSVKGIGLNMNIDFGSDTEMEAKVQAKISNALQAYQRLFEHIKMSSAGGSIINTKFFDFDINQYDTAMSKLQAYKKFIENMRNEAKSQFKGKDVLYNGSDKKYWTQASSAMGQVTKVFNEMKASTNTNPLENIFGKTDLTEVIEQLNTIISKLDEISVSAKGFAETFKNGLNVNASVEEIEKLTNRVKELESELAKIKTPTTVATPQESNISLGDASTVSDNTEIKANSEVIASIEKKKQELASYELQLEETRYEIEKLSKTENEAYGFKKAYSNMNDKYINSRKESLYNSIFGTDKSKGQGSMKYQTMNLGGNVEKGYAAWREELERLGYTLSELRKTNIGVEADIIPIDGKAITNAEEFRKALFGITSIPSDNIKVLNQQISELESKISSLKSEISSLESVSNNPKKDAFPDKDISTSVESATNSIKEENNVLEQNTQKVKENTQAKEQNANANLNKYDKRLDSYNGKVDKYQATIDRFNDGGWTSKTYLENVQAVRDAVKQYATLLNNIKTNQNGIATDEDIQNLDKYEKKIKDTIATVTNMSASEKGYSQLAGQKEIDKINKILRENSAMSSEAKAKIKAYKQELISGNPSVSLEKIHGEIMKIVNAEELAGRAGRSFFDTLKNSGFHQLAAQMAGMFGFYDVINLGKEAISTIVSLDDALVDLKKTTAMNKTQLEDFYYDANDVAKQMGVTTEEIITQASAWSRLGYSSQEAATTMAKLSSKFASISPGMSTDEAQEGLVSIMKAFDIDPDDVETEIMDKVNVLGNKFAEENQDVIEGLKRSAAAMSAMGQSFTDTAALFTGGMEILQDSESMGTALRTLSMRVRGYDEETNQLSDDLVNVTGEVADLTKTAQDSQGVSLFTDATQEHYKSMVEYLGDIADRWDQISEKNQTELLQKLFGKNRANESVCPYVQKCA